MDYGLHPLQVVAHDRLVEEVDSVFGEALAYEGRVAVDDLAEQQFRSDGDDLSVHVAAGSVLVQPRHHGGLVEPTKGRPRADGGQQSEKSDGHGG